MDPSWFIAFAVFVFICFTWTFIMLQIIERKINHLYDMQVLPELRNYKR